MTENKGSTAPALNADAPAKKIKVRFSLLEKLILLIVVIVMLIVILISFNATKIAGNKIEYQMMQNGYAQGRNLANHCKTALVSIALQNQVPVAFDRNFYNNSLIAGDIELQFKDIVDDLILMENVVYVSVINQNLQYIGYPDPSRHKFLDPYKPLPQLMSYKEYYQKKDASPNEFISAYKREYNIDDTGIGLSGTNQIGVPKLPPLVLSYFGEYYNARPKIRKTIAAGVNPSGIYDISYPIGMKPDAPNLNTYEGEVHIGLDRSPIEQAKKSLQKTIFLIGILAILGSGIAALIMTLLITAPVKTLVSAMQRVADGDLNVHVNIRSSDEIGLITHNFNSMTGGLRERERLRDISSKFAGDAVVSEMLDSGDIKLGGDYTTVTMLFCDIRSFTSTSEKMEPHDVVEMLNDYLTLFSDIIMENNGTIDKYVGDEIMAVYGVPKNDPRDAFNACKSAVDMIAALKILNEKRIAEGKVEIRVGIGLNTGQVISGNMGSSRRMDYTVIGDNVNLAARLCDNANKNGLKDILMAESTYLDISNDVIVNEVDPIYVKGKEKPIKIYELLDVKE